MNTHRCQHCCMTESTPREVMVINEKIVEVMACDACYVYSLMLPVDMTQAYFEKQLKPFTIGEA